MSFGNNVSYYRNKYGITQEDLAEKLNVTRQTVSRWETDSAFPEMEKVIMLCDLFNCDMETLVRGDVSKNTSIQERTKLDIYDKHMNRFSICITLGVCLILLGVTLLLFLNSINVKETYSVLALISFVTISVAIFVISGIMHNNFIVENKKIENYPPEKIKKFNHIKPFLFAGGITSILLGLIILILLTSNNEFVPSNFSHDNFETLAVSIFFIFITLGVGIIVFTGMQIEKYDVKKYNKESYSEENTESVEKTTNKTTKAKRIADALCGVTMLTATIIFLLLGFLCDLWHPGWVVFPIGGILCGIINTIITAIYGEN